MNDSGTPQQEGGNNSQAIEMPKTLTIGGNTYSVNETPELNSFVSALSRNIAQTEKTKLYTTINSLKASIAKLDKVVPVEIKESSIDVPSLVRQIVDEVSGTFKGQIDGIRGELAPIIESSRMDRESSIADYRNKIIYENSGACIPELIVGTTKEALDKSLTASKELFTKYGSKNVGLGISGTMDGTTHNAPASPNNAPMAQSPGTAVAAQQQGIEPISIPTPRRAELPTETKMDIANMSNKDFAANRDKLKDQLNSLFKS